MCSILQREFRKLIPLGFGFSSKSLTVVVSILCVMQCATLTEAKLQYFGNSTTPATATSHTERILQIQDRTSVFDPGTGRSFLATLCLFIFKIVKIACLCSFLSILFILILPLLPLLIPAIILPFLFAISITALIPMQMQLPPVVPVPTTAPPFISIPAIK